MTMVNVMILFDYFSKLTYRNNLINKDGVVKENDYIVAEIHNRIMKK